MLGAVHDMCMCMCMLMYMYAHARVFAAVAPRVQAATARVTGGAAPAAAWLAARPRLRRTRPAAGQEAGQGRRAGGAKRERET